METIKEPPVSTSTSFYAPLLISMIGIISSAIALTIYHLILTKYCFVSRNTPQRTNTTLLLRQTPESHGVDKKILERIPIIAYNLMNKKGLCRVDQNECAVCLGELEDEELVRLLPNCLHSFHVSCIDKWFVAHASCPFCRAPITDVDLLSVINLNDDDHENSSELLQSHGLLRHCVSLVVPIERRTLSSSQRRLLLSRSLSMDHNHEGDSSLTSKSAKLLRSLSRLGRGKGKGKGSQIIPY